MIVAWMLYATVIGALLYGAGIVLERAPAALGGQRRWAWSGVIGATLVLPLLAVLGRSRGAATGVLPPEAAGLVRQTMEPLVAASGTTASPWPGLLDAVAIAAWCAVSLVLVLRMLRGQRMLATSRGAWPTASAVELGLGQRFVDDLTSGAPVRITDGQGPAVAGALRSEILFPRWCLDLPAAERALILAHEAEHVRGRDPRLLLFGRVATTAAPWLLPLWWQVRRLRLAVEIDCDARVLRRGFDQPRYGRLLLDVGSRRSTDRDQTRAIAALAAPSSQLEKRIRAMFERNQRGGWMRATVAVTVAAGLVVVACESPTPFEAESAAAPEVSVTDVESTPIVAGELREALAGEKTALEAHYGELEHRFGPDSEIAEHAIYRMKQVEGSLKPLDSVEGAYSEWRVDVERKGEVPMDVSLRQQAEAEAIMGKLRQAESTMRLRQVAPEAASTETAAPAEYEYRVLGPAE